MSFLELNLVSNNKMTICGCDITNWGRSNPLVQSRVPALHKRSLHDPCKGHTHSKEVGGDILIN